MTTKRIIVLGAGYAGVLTAKRLEKKFRNNKNVKIQLIDSNPFHTMRTELHEVACGRVNEEAICIDLNKIFAGRDITLTMDKILSVDTENKILKSKTHEYNYDYLVIGVGSKPTYFGIEGAKEHTLPLWTYDDAVALKDRYLTAFRLASRQADRRKRQQLLTFTVIGGGFTGIELVGELAEWKDDLCKRFHINPSDVTIHIVDAMKTIIPNYPKNLIEKAEHYLKGMGVDIITGSGIVALSQGALTLASGQTIQSNVIVWAAGVEGNTLVESTDLKQEGRKRIKSNAYLQAEGKEGVYIVGDNISYIPEGHERPVPQMVENAKMSAKTVANNIEAACLNKELKTYKPSFHGSVLCIGSRYGMGHLGLPNKFIGLSGFMAMFIKHAINIMYFFSIAGFNKCWTYFLDEFVHIRNRRSIMGGMIATIAPSIWLLPLRIGIGLLWFQIGRQTGSILFTIVGGFYLTGFFTTLTSLTSIIYLLMVSVSELGGVQVQWLLLSSIALLGASGSVLGLDYYIQPAIKKMWSQIGIVKKYYLYVNS